MFRIFIFFLPIVMLAQTITIASWNVENLFDMHRDGTEYTEYVPGRHGWREALLAKKIRNLTEVICDLDADVIGLQEVENDRVLARLQQSLKRAGCGYRYRAITHSKETPIHNALLSRIPIKRKQDVLVTRYGHQRSILEATLDTDPPLRLFVNHWRSKRGPESERLVYAKALRKRLEKLPVGTEYLLLGDFNSNYNESVSIDAKHNDTHNVTGINNILVTRVDGKMVRLNTLKAGRHFNLWMELPAGERWSHNFFGDKEAIDAMLIPPALHDGRGWEYVRGSFHPYKPKYLFGRYGEVNRWAYKHGKHLGKGYSDHLPIVARFSTERTADTSTGKSSPSLWNKITNWFTSNATEVTSPNQSRITNHQLPTTTNHQPSTINYPLPTTIEELKQASRLTAPVLLRNVHVLFKRRESAVIQQTLEGEAILLYRSALQLEEGHCYDIEVYKKKRYKGLNELIDIEVVKDHGACESKRLILKFSPNMLDDSRFIGRVVRGVKGRYTHHTLMVDGVAFPLHFRRGAGRPKNGVWLQIDRAQIGYYKDHVELVVWDKGDWLMVDG